MAKRDSLFDIIKGFAIFLVALGHSMQYFVPNYENNPVFLWIYMFHMPLFFFVAGRYIIPSCEKSSLVDFGRSKIMRLFIPALIWGGILWLDTVFIIGEASAYCLKRYISSSILGYWFLTTLFALTIITVIIHKSFKAQTIRYTVWALILIGSLFVNNVYLNRLTTMAPFFAAGILLKHIDFRRIPWYFHLGNLVLFIILFLNYKFGYTFYEKCTLDISTIPYWEAEIMRLISGLSGIFLAIGLCIIISKIPYLSKYMWRLGLISLPIYCIHGLLLYILYKILPFNLPYWLSTFIVAFISVEISVVLYILISKSSFLKLVLFGEDTKQNSTKPIKPKADNHTL